jgi:uncharacterized membrane protein YdbT with pleckstrin-like domain
METAIWQGRPSWKGLITPLTISFMSLISGLIFKHKYPDNNISYIISMSLMILAAYISIKSVYCRYNSVYYISTTRIVGKYGILSTITVEIDVRYIQSISVTESITQRIFKTGNILFATPFGQINNIYFRNIDDPGKVKEIIHKCRECSIYNT